MLCSPHLTLYSLARRKRSSRGVNESEDVIEDKVATLAVGHQLEGLGVAHRPLLCVDLYCSLAFQPLVR